MKLIPRTETDPRIEMPQCPTSNHTHGGTEQLRTRDTLPTERDRGTDTERERWWGVIIFNWGRLDLSGELMGIIPEENQCLLELKLDFWRKRVGVA